LLRLDTAAIHLYTKVDTLWYEADYVFQPTKENIRLYQFKADWKEGAEYSLEVDSAAFEDLYGLVNKPIKTGIKIKKEEDFSSVIVTLTNCRDTGVVVMLVNGSDKVVKQVRAKNNVATFRFVNPGKYYLRAFVDANGNNLWDTGDYYADKQPEQVYYFNEEKECKAKWDLKITWDMNARKRFNQKPAAITKQKTEQQKKLQNRNLQRAKELGKEYVQKTTGVRL
jgi:hypothetical protein